MQVLIAKTPSLEITSIYKVGRNSFFMLGLALYKQPPVMTMCFEFYFLTKKARYKNSASKMLLRAQGERR